MPEVQQHSASFIIVAKAHADIDTEVACTKSTETEGQNGPMAICKHTGPEWVIGNKHMGPNWACTYIGAMVLTWNGHAHIRRPHTHRPRMGLCSKRQWVCTHRHHKLWHRMGLRLYNRHWYQSKGLQANSQKHSINQKHRLRMDM